MTLCKSQEALRIFSVQITAPIASHPMGTVVSHSYAFLVPGGLLGVNTLPSPPPVQQRPQVQHQDREDVQRVF